MTVTSLIYSAAGSPSINGTSKGICRTCGQSGVGTEFSKWVRPTFTDWDKIGEGDIICHACYFCFEDTNSILDSKLGKTRQRMRNYSHFVVGCEWFPLSKGKKSQMTELLMRSPEVAVIAASGQKHITFRAVPSMWQFEEISIVPDLTQLQRCACAIKPLYDGGFSKSEIESGRFNQKRVMEFGLAEWQRLDAQIRGMRGGKIFSLAMFLAQKEKEENDDTDTGSDSGQPIMAMLEGFE